ncbi:MAG: hypothetical protein LC122_02410 [Chitinophagales bacterium]|nr:hypothetical protein [Chitinophagales bacterium]
MINVAKVNDEVVVNADNQIDYEIYVGKRNPEDYLNDEQEETYEFDCD